jgi:RHS repeat-associated protein
LAGFNNGVSATNEYTYDNNGNLTKDSNKGITNIAYNSLNLPSKVTFSDGSTIVYSYAADGTKLRTVHTISGTTTQKDYCANVVYENGVQKMLLTEEGYVDLSAPTPTYYYYLKDHQGNNRVVINSSGTVAETNHYYPFGSLFASTSVQPYKYNGKELDTKKGLNWYDYGARHYDATLGRWLAVDPLAEKYYSTSTYGYCLNNPMKYVDPNGKVVSPYFDYDGNFLGVDEEGFAGQIKITTSIQFASMRSTGNFNTNAYLNLQDLALSAEAMSKIYTKVLDEQGYDIGLLEGNAVSVVGDLGDTFNNPSPNVRYASTRGSLGKGTFTISVNNSEKSVREELNTVENIQSGLGDHEFVGHGVNKLGDYNKTHSKVYEYQMKQPVYEKTTDKFKIHMSKNAALYNGK